MHLFRSTKRSKDSRSVSPVPSPRSTNHPTPAGSAARFRKRPTEHTNHSHSLLPLTANNNNGTSPSSTPAWKKQGHSNFLYGGQFYPERRRRKIRRNDGSSPLWQRTFCSSPTRMLLSLLILIYILILYVLWPLLQFVMQTVSSQHGSTILRGSDLLLHLSYSTESLARMEALRDTIQHMPPPLSYPRSEYLQQMYPQFYDRNADADGKGNNNNHNNNKPLRTLLTPDHSRPHCPSQKIDNHPLQVTLVLQTTIHRLSVVKESCRRWNSSPMIVVLALGEEESSSEYSELVDSYDCPNMQLIPYHFSSSLSSDDYPVNLLRNLGLEAVATSHVLVVDADFVPSTDLDQVIGHHLASLESRQALVIPAFERIMECHNDDDLCSQFLQTNRSFIPHTMEDLDTCMETHECRVFQSNNNPEGHASTRSQEWLYERRQQNDTALHPIYCFDSLRYEPYLVLPWCTNNHKAVPYYDERFHGYGKNKIQHVQHVRFLGFSFAVLPPQGFLVHAPHPESAMKEQWKDFKKSSLHRDMDLLYRNFLQELVETSRRERLDVQSIVGPCES